MWRESDASQPGVSREQVSDLGKPRKNSTIRHPDAQIPAETQEAQNLTVPSGPDVSLMFCVKIQNIDRARFLISGEELALYFLVKEDKYVEIK